MKPTFVIAAGLGLVLACSQTASAAETPRCLVAYKIDHTHVVNPSTVQFVMKDGTVWQNNLPAACNGLSFHGFTILGHDDEFCGGQGISILESHQVCQLGSFTAYVPATVSPAAQ